MAAILTGLQQCLSADFGIPTDIKFLFKKEVDGSTIIEEIKAHKCILALASDVFKTGFYGGFEDNGSIVITDAEVTKESFDAMISFIYDKMTNMSNYDFDILCSIYYLADKYNIPVLEKKILEVIQSKEISIENVVDVGVLAVKYEVHDKLAEAIYEACAQRLARIFNGELDKAVEYLNKIDADGSLDLIRYKSVMKIMARLRRPPVTPVCTNCKVSPCLTGVKLSGENFVKGAKVAAISVENITRLHTLKMVAVDLFVGVDKNWYTCLSKLQNYVFNCQNDV